MIAIPKSLEIERISHVLTTSSIHKESLGQYFTPYAIAHFMASLFPKTKKSIKLLDPGAGIGILATTFLERVKTEHWDIPRLHITAYEIDFSVYSMLYENIKIAVNSLPNSGFEVNNSNFLEETSFEYMWNIHQKYTHVIMNPPYKKIPTNSLARQSARSFGLETVNLYSAFLGASIALTEDEGYIVAIIPRSFCNGLYFKPFREYILENCSVKQIHLFESRNQAFKDEAILQENIIIMLQKNTEQKEVKITYSKNVDFSNIETSIVPFSEVLVFDTSDKYFCIPIQKEQNKEIFKETVSLGQLGIQVSTGPIVDFRVRNYLRKDFSDEAIPLIYPVHLQKYKLDWPKVSKKPNAIEMSDEIRNQLFPKGYYVVVKRFSSKEEKQRIVASLITPTDFVKESIAFENHLNVFHINKSGLPGEIALGLVVWLNTSFIDEKFRLFSGHTQVNATDLRNLSYPTYGALLQIGASLMKLDNWSQESFDLIAKEFLYD